MLSFELFGTTGQVNLAVSATKCVKFRVIERGDRANIVQVLFYYSTVVLTAILANREQHYRTEAFEMAEICLVVLQFGFITLFLFIPKTILFRGLVYVTEWE